MQNADTRQHGWTICSSLLWLIVILLMPLAVASAQDGAALQSTEDVGASQPLNPVIEALDLPYGPVVVLSPGTDLSLGMSWEPTVTVDPNNPQIVAVAQSRTVQISLDGGTMFNQVISGSTPMTCDDGTTPCFGNAGCGGIGTGICYSGQCQDGATYCSMTSDCNGVAGTASCRSLLGGDPSMAFDSQGRLSLSYLCTLPNAGRDVCITTFEPDGVLQFSPMAGVNWPVRATVSAGFGGQNADKQWLAADSFSGSPFQDRIYMVWSDLAGANNWEIRATFSSDQGQNWSAALPPSPLSGTDGRVWPSHNTVAPNGDVYAAYHSQTGFIAVPACAFPTAARARSSSSARRLAVACTARAPSPQPFPALGMPSAPLLWRDQPALAGVWPMTQERPTRHGTSSISSFVMTRPPPVRPTPTAAGLVRVHVHAILPYGSFPVRFIGSRATCNRGFWRTRIRRGGSMSWPPTPPRETHPASSSSGPMTPV